MTNTTHTATVSDAAVQAAIEAYSRQMDYNVDDDDALKAALTAALPHLALSSAPCSVEVKKLEWKEPTEDNSGYWKAKSIFGNYYVFNDGGWHVTLYDYPDEQFFEWSSSDLSKDTKQTAFAAAQADFEQRTLSAIITKPVDVAAVRELAYREGFEDAAEQSDNAINRRDDTTKQEALNEIRAMQPDLRALSPAEPAQVKQWQDIATAPKDGTEILAWREDCGWLIASYTSLDAFPMSQSELDELDEETLFKKDWFTQFGQYRLEGSEVPTHWMPLPAAPTSTTEAVKRDEIS